MASTTNDQNSISTNSPPPLLLSNSFDTQNEYESTAEQQQQHEMPVEEEEEKDEESEEERQQKVMKPKLESQASLSAELVADSPSKASTSSSVQTVIQQSVDSGGSQQQSRPSTSSRKAVEEPSNQAEPVSKPASAATTKSKPKSANPPMKKFNNLLPKFKTNKLEPLNVGPDIVLPSISVVASTSSTSSPKPGRKGKKLKRAKTKQTGHKNKNKAEQQPVETSAAAPIMTTTTALFVPSNSATTTSSTIANEYLTTSIPIASNSGDPNAPPTIQVVEVDANQLKTSRVIFAVPQFPGQPVIPIAYKISDRRASSIKPDGQNGHYHHSSMMNNELHFEVVWRNLIYYHQNVVMPKESKDAKASKGKATKPTKEAAAAAAKSKSKSNGQASKSKDGGGKKSKSNSVVSAPSPPATTVTRNGRPRPTLNNISGTFRSGQMTAIMGPSGAGKTVFLNCITGHLNINSRKENSGDILINGVKSIRIGFVEQFDHLLPHLTVRETLLFASRIKNAARYYLNHIKIVDNVLQRLDLAEFSETATMACSNGQRKRLSIAIELCFNSDILILDEPTTGLDSVTGFQIMNTLKTLTKRRRAISILATIHQPSTKMFELFDNLVVLSKEGTIMYQGSPQDLPQTLLLVGLQAPLYSNLSDFLLEVASGDFGRQSLHLLAHYNTEYNKTKIAEDLSEVEVTSLQEAVKRANQINKRSFLLCTWLLFIRTIVCNWRNPFNTQIRIISLIFCSIFLGILFTDVVGSVSTCPPTKYFLWRYEMSNILDETERQQHHVQENMGIIFMAALVSLFNSMLNIVITVAEEIAVFRREHDNYSYSIFSFYIAKLLADIPFTFPTTAMYVVIVHLMTGQIFDHWSRLYLCILPCCLTTFIGQLVGMTIGVIFSENIMASVYSVMLIIIPLIMFSGFFRLIAEMPWVMAQLSIISFLKQVINSLMIAIYGLGRCEHEDQVEREAFILRNITEAEARPAWITSLTSLIEYQVSMSESTDANVLAMKDKSLEPEDKLVRYMGLTGDLSHAVEGGAKVPLILQNFGLESGYDAYWYEIYVLLDYIVVFAITLYVVMVIKFNRKR